MSYWFREEVPALVRSISAIFECDDREIVRDIVARIVEVSL